MADLYVDWVALKAPVAAGEWSAIRIGPVARVARTGSGGAALLVPASDTSAGAATGSALRTTNIEYHPRRELVVRATSGESERAMFAVLECSSADSFLIQHFLRIAATLPLRDQLPNSAQAFDEEVRRLFELFRHMGSTGTRTVQGLWAEALLVARSRDPVMLVQAWHSDPNDLHDFVAGEDRLEVKSTVSTLREHEFSLEQLLRTSEHTLVASLQLDRNDDGANVFDILAMIKARVVGTELARRAEAIVTTSLGDAWREADELRFQVRTSLASLAVYRSADVPRMRGEIPPSVRNVRFRADLSAAQPVGPRDVSNGLLNALVPVLVD